MNLEPLRKARKAQKINLTQLGTILGVRRDTLALYEKGLADPRKELLEKWCKVLGLRLAIIDPEEIKKLIDG